MIEMTTDKKELAGVKLFNQKPTTLKQKDLYKWVIWQFPKQREGGLCGAVHPPIAEYGWLPAIILIDKQRVRVYGHVDETFSMPETAVEYFNKKG